MHQAHLSCNRHKATPSRTLRQPCQATPCPTAPPNQVQPGLFEGLMKHMCDDHTVPEDIGRLARAAGVKKLVLSHFVPGRDGEPESAYTDGAKAHFDGPVIAARDLMEH